MKMTGYSAPRSLAILPQDTVGRLPRMVLSVWPGDQAELYRMLSTGRLVETTNAPPLEKVK